MKWISVHDGMPEIPKDKYGLSVLVAEYDETFAECCMDIRSGYSVRYMHYGSTKNNQGVFIAKWWEINNIEFDFMTLDDHGNGLEWTPPDDKITHWMYLPEPPKFEENE